MSKTRSPQLYAPGEQYPKGHADARYAIVNDVYLRGKNKQKLMRLHVPALNELLRLENPRWHVQRDEFANFEYRFSCVENLRLRNKARIMALFMDRLSRISGYWNVYVEGTGQDDRALYLRALQSFEAFHGPPALSSVMLEVIQVQQVKENPDGFYEMSNGTWMGF